VAPELEVEVKMHLSLHHENIVNLYHIYSEEGYIHLIMDYAGESLFALRKNCKIPSILPEEQIIDVLGQLISAVSYLHGRGIVHADIKL
jgi:serine/threonine protein kinase